MKNSTQQKPKKTSVTNVDWLHLAAKQIEADAMAQMPAWLLTGRGHRYCEDMGKAAAMRQAAQIKGVRQRREFLRAVGIPC